MSTYIVEIRVQIEADSEEAAVSSADAITPAIEAIDTVDAVYVDDVRPITE